MAYKAHYRTGLDIEHALPPSLLCLDLPSQTYFSSDLPSARFLPRFTPALCDGRSHTPRHLDSIFTARAQNTPVQMGEQRTSFRAGWIPLNGRQHIKSPRGISTASSVPAFTCIPRLPLPMPGLNPTACLRLHPLHIPPPTYTSLTYACALPTTVGTDYYLLGSPPQGTTTRARTHALQAHRTMPHCCVAAAPRTFVRNANRTTHTLWAEKINVAWDQHRLCADSQHLPARFINATTYRARLLYYAAHTLACLTACARTFPTHSPQSPSRLFTISCAWANVLADTAILISSPLYQQKQAGGRGAKLARAPGAAGRQRYLRVVWLPCRWQHIPFDNTGFTRFHRHPPHRPGLWRNGVLTRA